MTSQIKTPYWQVISFALLPLLCFSYTPAPAASNPAVPSGVVRIHYFRPNSNYSWWAIYTWNAHPTPGWCQGEVEITGTDSFGVYFDVPVDPTLSTDLGLIINNCPAGGIKDPGPDQHLNIAAYNEAWVIHADATVFTTQPTPQQIANAILSIQEVYWLDRTHLAIQPQYIQSGATYALNPALAGGLNLTSTGITGGNQIALTAGGTLSQDELTRNPQLAPYTVLQVPSSVDLATIKQALKGEIALSVVGQNGMLQYAAGIQTAGVVDDLYYYPGRLGAVFNENSYPVRIKLWAPTAQSVSLLIFDHENDTAPSATIPMQENNGVWVANGASDWIGKYYVYSLSVWVPIDAAVDTNVTTDPYSTDIAVNGVKSTWKTTGDLSQYPPDGGQQQAAVARIQGSDGYNWGYDPVHYMAPQGSYAMVPRNRVREYRAMVMGLHNAGLRVVQDVVFNHTSAYGEGPNSNLDEVVPGYYHRLDANGNLETGSCCPDTASEHRRMEKLMIDTLVLNAREYKIDGFRFDIMSFHFIYNMQHIQAALSALTTGRDGVDGSKIYLYGEGFNFGDTANNQIGPNASQINLYGFGIGTFNDRIRDGIRGGSPFTDERVQGFATGLFTDPSDFTNQNPPQSGQQNQLLQYSDWVRVGLTGNLRDYSFVNSQGNTVAGAQIDYNGQPTGYTATPIESVNYCSVHDNQDLFDAVQLKSSFADSIAVRARRHVMAMSLVTLGQGVPFFQAGDDMLRSKDMDQNSYDSGDWFNKIDWSGATANWDIGLPLASQNGGQWSIMTPLLSDPAYTPQPRNIDYSRRAFLELMQIRYSSALFHMASFNEIQRNLTFLNTGPNQIPGVIVMKLDANGGDYGHYKTIVVIFNATNQPLTFTDTSLAGLRMHLHPIQWHSSDTLTRQSTFNSRAGSATVAARTTAVFVREEQ